MEPSKPDPNNQPNGAPHGSGGSTHANGPPSESHRWLRPFLEFSSEVVKVVDPDGTLRYASPPFGRVFGYDPEEAIGTMNVFDHIHPDDLPRVLAECEKALAGEKATSNSTASATPTARGGGWSRCAPT